MLGDRQPGERVFLQHSHTPYADNVPVPGAPPRPSCPTPLEPQRIPCIRDHRCEEGGLGDGHGPIGYVIAQTEYPAGPDHVIVVYQTAGPRRRDRPREPHGLDRGGRTGTRGLRAPAPLDDDHPARHAGTAFGDEGSGYQTKVAVAVVYERWPGVPG